MWILFTNLIFSLNNRYSVQEKINRHHHQNINQNQRSTEEDRNSIRSHKVTNDSYHEMNHNQPKYYNGNINGNNNGHISHNGNNGSAVQRERYQHPALTAIINESQGMKFRGEFYL